MIGIVDKEPTLSKESSDYIFEIKTTSKVDKNGVEVYQYDKIRFPSVQGDTDNTLKILKAGNRILVIGKLFNQVVDINEKQFMDKRVHIFALNENIVLLD